ncbi:MAG: YciI family protein [Propionibacteriaceae bacterium]|jgi:uncharacterized protein YciI|nr:YciI family protein [Propionibacteriaceae bacterium]
MDTHLYLMLMQSQRPADAAVVSSHVEHLRRIDSVGHLVLCGPFTDDAGGMVVLRARSFEEANDIAAADPFVAQGFRTYQLRTVEVANQENGYLLG